MTWQQAWIVVEMPLAKGVFSLVMAAAAILALVVFGKVFLLGVNAGRFYKNRAMANVSDITVLPGRTGHFFRSYRVCRWCGTSPTFSAVLDLSDFFKKQPEEQEREIE